MSKPSLILTLRCPDRVGIVAAVSGFIAEQGGWIIEANHHSDRLTGNFFMRQEIAADSLPFAVEAFRERFAPIAERFGMVWQITDTARAPRVVLLVSKFDHCLADLLYRHRSQDFHFDIPCVISNHEDLRGMVEWHGIPFRYLPVDPERKDAAFEQVERLFHEYQGDVMVLARYMQILPPWLCARLPGQIINIHHSFLPSFIGARPYHQAYTRGVKLIGATCHYVTADLDQGPIIEQDVIRVNHTHTPDDMIRLGRDVERTTLARGLRAHCEQRVLVDGNKTIVLI